MALDFCSVYGSPHMLDGGPVTILNNDVYQVIRNHFFIFSVRFESYPSKSINNHDPTHRLTL